MNQKEQVLDYLSRHESITPMDAFSKLGITKLATVVSDLRRNDGMEFIITRENAVNRNGNTTSYCRYSLKKEMLKDE